MGDTQKLIDAAKDRVETMTQAEREEMYRRQRSNFVRAMTTPCEHGELDFEQCSMCRSGTPARILHKHTNIRSGE
ncbi:MULTISPECIES: hypothetical protein [Agrobacterium]|uniref:hypothetical protein n=1 Tax=Agrobacterium TaxID=357 RepID=UPI00049FB1D7|nr:MULTISPECIES: hypothetical protein [Agrobacterium]KDR87696.1 hypothetical protein K538_06995 [Agrobacterium tumefaciens GW4]KVK49487.1 hypothetical protein L903_19390 [Agrobacterium sp. JL28]KVK49724.1 hypothetical protein L904_19380 [Agrobacterium sp. LY4]